MHASLHAQVDLCAQKDPVYYPDSIYTLISLIQSNLAEIWACARKHIGCMHTSLRAPVILCAQKGPAWSPDSIDTLISLIWACACKNIVWMHLSLYDLVTQSAQIGLAYSTHSIYTQISLFWLNLAKIRAQARQKIVCMHACLHMHWNHSPIP